MVRPITTITALLILTLSSPAQAQDDVSSDIEAIRNNRNMPGMSALVVKSGYVIAEGAAGVRRQGQPNPLLVTDQINIASCTKWMTATIAGRLVDQGIIQWDTSVRELFPNFQQFDAAFHDATLSDFLAHRAGVQASPQFSSSHWSALYVLNGSVSERRRWASEAVLTDEPAVTPGTYLYANQGYAVAATMMEIASGTTWEQLMAQEVFQPLRMNSAFLGQSFNDELPPNFPVGHDLENGATIATPRTALSPSFHIPLQAAWGPGGYVVCTLNDWAKFLHAQVTADESDYLSAASTSALHSPFTGEEGYGLGVWAVNRSWASPGQALSHGGDIFGHRTVFWIAPAKDFVVVVFANCSSEDDRTSQALDEVAGLLVGRYHNASASGRPLEFQLGDANDDGVLDNFDISWFVLALTNPAAFQAAFPDVDPDVVLDMNGDGGFDNLDIASFVAVLTGGGKK